MNTLMVNAGIGQSIGEMTKKKGQRQMIKKKDAKGLSQALSVGLATPHVEHKIFKSKIRINGVTPLRP